MIPIFQIKEIKLVENKQFDQSCTASNKVEEQQYWFKFVLTPKSQCFDYIIYDFNL